jgi:cobalt/nickel transport system permease protein
MWLEGLERHSAGKGPLHRLDVRIKLIATLTLVVAIVVTPFGAWRALGAEGILLAFLIGLSGIPPGELLRRWLVFLALVGFLALVIAPAHPARAQYGLGMVAACVLVKNSLALFTILILAGVTPLPELLVALRKLGVPLVLVTTLQFMDRYRHVLTDELGRMATARRARAFSRRPAMASAMLSGLIGILFLRAMERAERVHSAMVARGWSGELQSLDE